MLSDTLAKGLGEYRIGAKIRALRLEKGLGQVQLGAHTGLSPAMLSKIERGQLFPTLPTLLRIAMVFGVGLEHFFLDDAERPAIAVTRKKDRIRLPNRPGKDPAAFYFESLDFPVTDRKMDAYYAEFPGAPQRSPPHHHKGVELIYVLSGRLIMDIAGEEIPLDHGDSIHFDSNALHSYRKHGQSLCTAIVVVVPGR